MIREFFDFRKALREETYKAKIVQMEKALSETNDKAIQDKLRENITAVKGSLFTDEPEVFVRIR